MDNRHITCAQCGTAFDESADTPLQNRAPCPNCGSVNRTIHVTGVAAVAMTATATLTVGRPQTAEASGFVHDATVKTATTESKEASVTSLGLPTRAYDIRISSLETGSESCLVEVFDEGGTLLVSGGGTNEVDALLEVILYMLPQHHPEYPQSLPTLDDE